MSKIITKKNEMYKHDFKTEMKIISSKTEKKKIPP